MKVDVKGKKVKVTDDDRNEKKTLVKHKNKIFDDLVQTEKDELLLALLQRAGMASKSRKIKAPKGVA